MRKRTRMCWVHEGRQGQPMRESTHALVREARQSQAMW